MDDVVITEGTDPRVVSCPGHRWRLEDRTPEGMTAEASLRLGDWYICEICTECRGIRCDRYIDRGEQRCLEARHHDGPHRFPSGGVIEVGE